MLGPHVEFQGWTSFQNTVAKFSIGYFFYWSHNLIWITMRLAFFEYFFEWYLEIWMYLIGGSTPNFKFLSIALVDTCVIQVDDP